MNETILVVDDEDRMRKLIGAYLKKSDYKVLEACNGYEAIKIFDENRVHLIVLDVMMPIMDGYEVCKEIRKKSNVPIVFLTAKSEAEDMILGFELGSDHYVTKPFDTRVLLAKIKSIINRTYNIGESTEIKELNFEGIRVDLLSHNAFVEDKEIYLAPKEYELLVYLIKNKNIVLSREQILNSIWGIDFDGDLRTVDTHIKKIREKLDTKANLITTIRGSGYKFG
ncbi:DNA-binding response regulator, OmpR family, contains REC and winged-helix (wHTH) domain [Clostridium cavendishii DSM 21758]|uniref:Stage 0 sporulation protein A homolog n=1 Tax=Clostridium cavendishii DSM 21758 TaxID=1121302 RepID=A0A1M6F0Q3_9CLOT|nr:response regulator transcription factor [Clostridium cavendishii]SHI91209.1 DNA-binding response regulator, OmpR family, contains REC and winged-helix (wHTH) domain [Clostridium cavendishii DSM 21758]